MKLKVFIGVSACLGVLLISYFAGRCRIDLKSSKLSEAGCASVTGFLIGTSVGVVVGDYLNYAVGLGKTDDRKIYERTLI